MYIQARLWTLLAGVAILLGRSESLRGSALVAELKAKAKAALLNPTETVEEVVTVETTAASNDTSPSNITVTKTKSLLTGNPQKDYIYDPNLPRELNGYNLSSYPFYNGVPDDIDFKCDDLHDGFYASVPHKCQVYHHCLFGTRYDFLCANYTAFDQKTFICHFVSEVDCNNSPKYFQRNEALYKAASTAPPIVLSTTTSTTTTTSAPTTAAQRTRVRRPFRRRRPVYEYYYDDQYDDEEYYDDDPPPPRRKSNRKHRPQVGHSSDEDDYYEGGKRESSRPDGSRSSSSARSDYSRGEGATSKEAKPTVRVSGPAAGTVYDRPRVPPKIRRPVPIHERDKYDYTVKSTDVSPAPTESAKKVNKPQNKHEEEEEEYYDYEYEEDYVKPQSKRGKGGSDMNEKGNARRSNGRHRPRQHTRRRPDRYDDDYEEARPVRPRKRQRHDEPQMGRGNRGGYRGYSREEPDPVPAERPGFISTGRFSHGSRRINEEDRSQSSSKKSYARPVYDDEEEGEEYYDDDEGEARDEEVNRRIHKPSTIDSNNGRHTEDSDFDSRRKSNGKEPEGQNPSKLPSKSSLTSELGGKQGESTKSIVKPSNRQKSDTSSVSRDQSLYSGCSYRSCEEEYSDYSTESSSEEKSKRVEAQNPSNEKGGQNSANDRERLFSSRFRETQNESKSKQQPTEIRRPHSYQNSKDNTQDSESQQRYKPTLRSKSNSDHHYSQEQTTPTNLASLSSDTPDDTVTNKYANFRSKGRIVPPTPLLDNYKPIQTTEQLPEIPSKNQEPEQEQFSSEISYDASPDKPVSPRPFSGMYRRPIKPVTETMPFDEILHSEKTPLLSINYKNAQPIDEEDEKPLRKEGNPTQNYRRFKVEPPQFKTGDDDQPKQSNTGNNFRRPSKPVEDKRPEEVSYSKLDQEDNMQQKENIRIEEKPSNTDTVQLGGRGYGGAYRRVKISAIPTPGISTIANETPQSHQGTPVLNPVSNPKRPLLISRPLSNYPVVVEDTTKNSLPVNGPLRRPIKQKISGLDVSSPLDDYNSASGVTGNGESYQHGSDIVSPGPGYFLPKRSKVRIEENPQRGLEQYPKQLTLNREEQFSKQTPKVEITAPGPSAPDMDIATAKSNYKNEYNNGSPGFTLNIPEEEYDVTLNDALQPSTLHPTRSLVEYQQTRLKTRDYQTNRGRMETPEYRGRVSYLLPAASQQYISMVQSIFTTDKQEENPITARYTSDKGNKKTASLDQEEYEAVVLTAPADQWPNQRRNRPTEWYW